MMDRRSFFSLAPAFPVAAVSVSLVLKEDGKDPIDLDVSVLKIQPGDTLVLQCSGPIRQETAERIQAHVEHRFPGIKAMVLGDSLALEGVLRQSGA